MTGKLFMTRDGNFDGVDAADVSWVTPVGQIMTSCAPAGTKWHTWQFAASAGMSIGHKGMLYASEVLACAGSKLIRQHSKRNEADINVYE